MNIIKKAIITICLTFVLAVMACAQNQTEEQLLAKVKWQHVEMQGYVKDINFEKREFTIEDSETNQTILTASEDIKRFDEIRIGDFIRAEYLTFLQVEFREPTAEEKENPLEVIVEASKAPAEVDPAGKVGAVIKAVVKITAINFKTKMVTIKGPRGNSMTLPVEDDAVLEKLQAGQVVIMTYAEAVALSLEKVKMN